MSSDKAREGQRRRSKTFRDKHVEQERQRAWLNSQNTEKRIIYRTRSRAKAAGIPFDLAEDDVVVPTHCPVLGIPLVRHQGKRGYHPDSPSLDRKVPALGYVKGNVVVISARANLLKNDATLSELEAVVHYLRVTS